MKRLAAFFLIASIASWVFADGIHMRHTVTLKPGWNAFYLPVTPPDAADAQNGGVGHHPQQHHAGHLHLLDVVGGAGDE